MSGARSCSAVPRGWCCECKIAHLLSRSLLCSLKMFIFSLRCMSRTPWRHSTLLSPPQPLVRGSKRRTSMLCVRCCPGHGGCILKQHGSVGFGAAGPQGPLFACYGTWPSQGSHCMLHGGRLNSVHPWPCRPKYALAGRSRAALSHKTVPLRSSYHTDGLPLPAQFSR